MLAEGTDSEHAVFGRRARTVGEPVSSAASAEPDRPFSQLLHKSHIDMIELSS
jgi:hypothetical protein